MDIRNLSKKDLTILISGNANAPGDDILSGALSLRKKAYGDSVFIRGLIEFTNYCKNNCLYCGIGCANKNIYRYRLTKEQIMGCADAGYNIGLRTFVLQGGEDVWYTDDRICDIVYSIKNKYPDCAVTLSIGEKPKSSYAAYKNAGADRYLLRHETADNAHYRKLHPAEMSLENRKRCLYDLKELGFQTGAGFMVGSPYQTYENLADDLLFLKELEPEMVGIGPFIPHKDTKFRDCAAGSIELTITMLALTRLMLPDVLLPATTALATIAPDGRERAFSAGANVVMPNLSPSDVRDSYTLYNNKANRGSEAAEGISSLVRIIENAGCKADFSRGDFIHK